MWTKEDLQNKYVKLSSQQDYETVTKVLHEFGFKQYNSEKNDRYYKEYPILKTAFDNTYYLYSVPTLEIKIPIQQFYDYLNNKTLQNLLKLTLKSKLKL